MHLRGRRITAFDNFNARTREYIERYIRMYPLPYSLAG
jgi:hypothetical protein